MTEELDVGQRDPGYLCGRLLAIFESLQYVANKTADQDRMNQTVTDRYYSLASTQPAVAFAKIEDLGQKHLRKLRRDNMGAKIRIEKELQELHGLLEQACACRFPAQLDLVGQGRFALGYHHQRAQHMKQALEAKQSASAKQKED